MRTAFGAAVAIGVLAPVAGVRAGAAGTEPALSSHAQSTQFSGLCQSGEAGEGSMEAIYDGLAPGQYSVVYALSGVENVSFTNSFTVSSVNPEPLVMVSDLQPGTYGLLPSIQPAGGSLQSGASTKVTIPDCLSNGAAALITAPVIGISATQDGNGYSIYGVDGNVYAEGDAGKTGAGLQGTVLNAPIVGMATASGNQGAWLVSSDGGVFSSGTAHYFGSVPGVLQPGQVLNKPIVGMAPTADGLGYWVVASDGGIFTFGDAAFHGSTGAIRLNQPIVGMAADDATGGYWLVAADGGVFSFDAPFLGSTGNLHLNKPIVGMEAAPDGSGYRFVASDGGVFCFGLPFAGSMGGTPLNQPIVGMAPAGPIGYWLVAADGGLFSFGGAPFLGSPTA